MTLRDLRPGQSGIVNNLEVDGIMRRRLLDMGVTPGVEILVDKVAPFGDPMEVHLRGYALSLRKHDAENIILA